jgi:hypothetical protein
MTTDHATIGLQAPALLVMLSRCLVVLLSS